MAPVANFPFALGDIVTLLGAPASRYMVVDLNPPGPPWVTPFPSVLVSYRDSRGKIVESCIGAQYLRIVRKAPANR